MGLRRIWVRLFVGVLSAVVGSWAAETAQAQNITPNAGVVIDANGVLRMQTFADPTGALMKERISGQKEMLANTDAAKSSKLRKVSLNRLEAAIKAQAASDRKPTDEMRFLAGLTRLQYVFFYPETGDIVVAGPAEGFASRNRKHGVAANGYWNT